MFAQRSAQCEGAENAHDAQFPKRRAETSPAPTQLKHSRRSKWQRHRLDPRESQRQTPSRERSLAASEGHGGGGCVCVYIFFHAVGPVEDAGATSGSLGVARGMECGGRAGLSPVAIPQRLRGGRPFPSLPFPASSRPRPPCPTIAKEKDAIKRLTTPCWLICRPSAADAKNIHDPSEHATDSPEDQNVWSKELRGESFSSTGVKPYVIWI
jgi:hypothetical protein